MDLPDVMGLVVVHLNLWIIWGMQDIQVHGGELLAIATAILTCKRKATR
jgi:hypothetical protein